MPSIRQSIRSSTASKRPTSAIADGQIALNTASGTPGMFFKDSAGNIIKTGPAHYGASAPNSSPAVGGSTGNSIGEAWLDSSLTPAGWKIWNGSAWVNATPLSSDTVQGLVELATNAETQAGADTARAVTSAGLQSKVSDSISTASSSGIASSSAVKTAYDLANAALPKSGGIITGNLEIGSTGSLTFEGSTADGFETTLAVVDPTLDRTITFPNITGTVVTTGDTGTVTSTMILDGTIVDADINASAEIAVSKLADGAARQLLQTDAAGTGVEWASNIDIPGTLDVTSAATFDSTVAVTGALTKSGNNVVTVGDTGTVTSTMILDGTILNADINASAAIVDTKLATIATAGKVSNSATTATSANTASAIVARDGSGNFTAGTITAAVTGAASSNVLKAGDTMTGVLAVTAGTAALPGITFSGDPNTGIYSPGADQLAVATNGVERVEFGTAEVVFNDGGTDYDFRVEGDTNANLLFVDASTDRVGVGSSTPATTLDVNGDVTITDKIIHGGDTNTAIRFPANDTVTVETAGSERARIDSSGRLLVGTSTSKQTNGAKLEIVGSRAANGIYEIALHEDAIHPLMTFSRGAALVSSGNGLGEIGFFGHDGTDKESEAARITVEVDGTPGANDMPGRLVFSTTADGASSPTEAMRINNQRELLIGTTTRTANGGVLQVSNGITFPATQVACTDPNTLDDYEEGTWTPGQGTGVTAIGTFSSVGRYTKIGRVVNYEGYIAAVTSVAFNPAGGNLTTDLPFSVVSGSGTNGSAINGSASVFILLSAGGTVVAGSASIAATSVIYFSGQYIV